MLIGVLLLLAGCASSSPPPPAPPRVVVSDLQGNALWLVDPASEEARRLPMPGGPAGMALGRGVLAVALLGRPYLEILEAGTLAERRRVALGSPCSDVAWDADSEVLAAACPEAGTVVLIGADAEPRSVRVGGNPFALAWHGDRVFVVNPGKGSVQWLDGRRARLLGEVKVGLAPRALAVQGDRLLVSLYDEDAVVSLPLGNPKAGARRLPVGGSPSDLVPTGGGVLVSLAAEGALAALDLSTGRSTLLPVGRGAAGMARSPDGQFLFVCCEVEGAVSVVGLHDNELVSRIALDRGARPREAVYLP